MLCDLISKYKNVNAGKELIESLNSAKTLNVLLNKLFCKVFIYMLTKGRGGGELTKGGGGGSLSSYRKFSLIYFISNVQL